jgi:hypothetical protein
VSHDDREIEFILFKRQLNEVIAQVNGPQTLRWSCEQWASYLVERFGLSKCEVSEDGENGAIVEA